MKAGVTINRPPRDGHMAFVRSPDLISMEILQKGNSTIGRALDVDAEHRHVVNRPFPAERELETLDFVEMHKGGIFLLPPSFPPSICPRRRALRLSVRTPPFHGGGGSEISLGRASFSDLT